MITTFVSMVAGALAAFGAGVFLGPHITGTAAAVATSHAVKKAQAVLAAEKARVAGLAAAQALVAAHPSPTGVTGTVTGPTGTSLLSKIESAL